MKRTLTTLVSASAVIATTVFAAVPDSDSTPSSPASPTFSDSGFYVNGNLGGGSWDVFSGGFIFGVNIGYQINQYVAAEVGYMMLPTIDFSATFFGVTTSAKISTHAFLAALKVMYPFTQQFSVFVKGGGAYEHATASLNVGSAAGVGQGSEGAWALYFAGGFEYAFTPNVSANIQAVVMPQTSNFPTMFGGMIGASYKFSV